MNDLLCTGSTGMQGHRRVIVLNKYTNSQLIGDEIVCMFESLTTTKLYVVHVHKNLKCLGEQQCIYLNATISSVWLISKFKFDNRLVAEFIPPLFRFHYYSLGGARGANGEVVYAGVVLERVRSTDGKSCRPHCSVDIVITTSISKLAIFKLASSVMTYFCSSHTDSNKVPKRDAFSNLNPPKVFFILTWFATL